MKPTYLIAGGGTGGHIFPAVAIGKAIMAKVPEAAIVFIGTRYGMEKDLIPKLGLPLRTLPIRGFLGKGILDRLALIWRLPASFVLSLWYLLKFRPKVVVGVGGYASGPLLFLAAMLRRPTLIQEQNAFPGVTNRLCSRFARLACLGFAEAGQLLHCPSVETGNPVRQEFSDRPAWSFQRNRVLVLGGSQGARALNQEVPGILLKALEKYPELSVIHQAGKNHRDQVQERYGDWGNRVQVVDFIEDMAGQMDGARIVFCRAGASTISELKQVRIPAVLIPFPGATHDHQTHNARSLANVGAGLLIPESKLSPSQGDLVDLIGDHAELSSMASAYPVRNPDSANLCAEAVFALERGQQVDQIIEELHTHVSKN